MATKQNVADVSEKTRQLKEWARKKKRRDITHKLFGGQMDTDTDKTSTFSRQVEIEGDIFQVAGVYADNSILIMPPYAFESLYEWYENSDALQTCIDAIINNVDGFGHVFQYLGEDLKLKDSAEAMKQLTKIENFFSQVNDNQSFRTIRKAFRKELEIIGCSAFEIIRNNKGDISMMFHAKMKNMRMSIRSNKSVKVPVTMMRDGKQVTIIMRKFFRKFCQLDNGSQLKWFKEFGDPRFMDASSGEYKKTAVECKPLASEILFVKNEVGNEPYGLPRWIGAMLQVLGRRNAHYINYDLGETQGIPPLAVSVSGGILNDESLDDLEAIIKGARGVENWNKVLILESVPNSASLDEKGGAKIELKNLTEYRKEDQMFDRYLKATEADIRGRYRLADLYVGRSENYTHSTSKSAQKVTEEQMFVPEREDFDEIVNMQLLKKEFNITLWKFVTKGPRLSGADDISQGVDTFGKAAAFTINNAIEQANIAFNTQMSKFEDTWANYPFPLVMQLIKLGRLKIEGLENAQLPTQITQTQVLQENVKKMSEIVGIAEDLPDIEELEGLAGLDSDTQRLVDFLMSLKTLVNKTDSIRTAVRKMEGKKAMTKSTVKGK